MSNIKKAQKNGAILSNLALRAIMEEDHIKSTRHLKNFIHILDNTMQYSSNRWSVLNYEEYDKKESVFFCLLNTLLQTPLKTNKDKPLIIFWQAIGVKTDNSCDVIYAHRFFKDWFLEGKSRLPTLSLILKLVSPLIADKADHNKIKDQIRLQFKNHYEGGICQINSSEFLMKSNCPDYDNRLRFKPLEAAFNTRNAWIIRQAISDSFSDVEFKSSNNIDIP